MVAILQTKHRLIARFKFEVQTTVKTVFHRFIHLFKVTFANLIDVKWQGKQY